MKGKRFTRNLVVLSCLLCLCICWDSHAQSWWQEGLEVANVNPRLDAYRPGKVLISDYLKYNYNAGLGVINKYGRTNNRAAYFSLNEPDNWNNFNGDSLRVGLATGNNNSYTTLVASNYSNFYDSTHVTDVHNSTAEFQYNRGMPDYYGYRDGGRVNKTAVLKLLGRFSNNNRAYVNDEFDLLNMRVFTSNSSGNLANIKKFYAIRLEDFRGVNFDIIEEGWGMYLAPAFLRNYFAGKTGIGTADVSHMLTVQSNTDPLRLIGLQASVDKHLLTVDRSGVVHKMEVSTLKSNIKGELNNRLISMVDSISQKMDVKLSKMGMKVDSINSNVTMKMDTMGMVIEQNMKAYLDTKMASMEMTIFNNLHTHIDNIANHNNNPDTTNTNNNNPDTTTTAAANQTGVVQFVKVFGDKTITSADYLYIHNGVNALYTLPDPAESTGKVFRFVNVGEGIITFNMVYFVGNESRRTLLNSEGNHAVNLLSDGSKYIAI